MQDLRKKMFWTLFLVLIMLLTTLTGLMGYREYMDIHDQIKEDLGSAGRLLDRVYLEYTPVESDEEVEAFRSRLFEPFSLTSDLPTYIVIASSSIISEILYFNTDGDNLSKVYQLAESILSSKGREDEGGTQFITSTYSWAFQKNGSLTIMDISSIRSKYFEVAGLLVLIYLGAVLLIFWICKVLVTWMIRPIEQTFAKQKQFIADASHELKTPLAVIYSNTQAFEKDGNTKWIRNIQSETERMNRLITDLLELTRMEQQAPEKSRINLSRLIEKEALSVEAIMFEKGIELDEQVEPNLYITANEGQIRQLALILIDNAIHHAQNQIFISLKSKKEDVILSVSNNGEPIDPKDLPHIFERFYRSSKSRNRNENRYGLGLAIAKNIVDLSEGNIQVISDEKQTTFEIRFKKAPLEKGN